MKRAVVFFIAFVLLVVVVFALVILVIGNRAPPTDPMTAHECLLAITALELFEEDAIYEAPTFDEFTKAMEWKAVSLGLIITEEGYECP